ncbi:unnamed protein product [Citrullus colocynthis]|uniref:Uncharacterized protein n=1 Tax=Citrullus colocynthis TaxID=252529 RepID=A0ABP0YI59_9ROSI
MALYRTGRRKTPSRRVAMQLSKWMPQPVCFYADGWASEHADMRFESHSLLMGLSLPLLISQSVLFLFPAISSLA